MKVSIITINYNSSRYTIKLVDSILSYLPDNVEYEIIITDNASSDNDYEFLKNNISKNSKINISRSSTNTGFAGGNMHGYSKSTGEYLLFINNDCVLLNDVISPLINYMEKDKSIGLLTGKVYGEDGKYTGTHKLFPSLSKSLFGSKVSRMLKKNKFVSSKISVDKPIAVEVVTGAFMFFRRDIFMKVNGFDTLFFLDCEEEDISKRIWNIGKKVFMIPEPEVLHKHGGSKDGGVDLRNEYYISYKKLIFKHYNKVYAVLMLFMVYLKILKLLIYGRCDISLIKLAFKGFPERCSLRYKQKK
tara:strand:+ start:1321 stop:2226 length:906 start_codon:yes stop_codon:yes gene_type:complete